MTLQSIYSRSRTIFRACLLLILLTVVSTEVSAQCDGASSTVSIPINVGCGNGNPVEWDGPVGGGIIEGDPGILTDIAETVTINWTSSGTFRLKRTFPSNCTGTPLYSQYITVLPKPAAPGSTEVNQQAGCGIVKLNYTGSVYNTFWQTSSTGTLETYRTTRDVSATGTYHARIKGSNGCWSSSRSVTVSSVPAAPVAGTLSAGGNYYGSVSKTLLLTGKTGNIKHYKYTQNGGPEQIISNTSTQLNVSFSNNSNTSVSRQYWAVVELNNCEEASNKITITLNALPPPTRSVCVGESTYHSIHRPSSCGGGTASIANGSGGTISEDTDGDSNFKVTWDTPGTYTLKRHFTWPCDYDIPGETIVVHAIPTGTPPSPIIVSDCGGIILDFPGNPATDVEWHWQGTNPNGFQLNNANTYQITSPGTYYAKARSTGGCWAPTSSSKVIVASDFKKAVVPLVDYQCATNGTDIILTTDNSVDRWYSTPTSSTPLSSTNVLTTSMVAKDLFIYRNVAGGCTTRILYRLDGTASLKCTGFLNSTSVVKPQEPDTLGLVTTPNIKSISYFDGLGRPSQSVAVKQSPLQKDIVTPSVYDANGREPVKYLPYVAATGDGSYKSSPLKGSTGNYDGSTHHTFYTQANDLIARDTKPYAVTIFEPSPMSRVIEQGAPGTSWQPDNTNSYNSTDHTIKKSYDFNLANEVLKWTYTYPTSSLMLGQVEAGTATAPVYYAANQLYKNKTKDEQGNQVIEYVDQEGRTVLKRVQAVAGNPSTTDANKDANWAGTYYIYDDFSNLVCVIPPEATKRLPIEYYQAGATTTTKQRFLVNWAFRYRYDGRKRMSIKQVPGAKPVYMVYDQRDRLILTQDGNQRKSASGTNLKQWLFTKYDVLNRPIITGLYTHTGNDTSQVQMQTFVNNQRNLLVNSSFYEAFNGTSASHGYTNQCFPTSGTNIYTVSYFDNYQFTSLIGNTEYNFKSNELSGQATSNFAKVTGQSTGSKVNILGTTNYLYTVNYFDDDYRVIQTVSGHQKGFTRVTNIYDFVGKVMSTFRRYSVDHGSGAQVTTLKERFVYDHAGRLLVTRHSVNGKPEVVVTGNYYNELGQLIAKGLHAKKYPPVDNEIGTADAIHYETIERTAHVSTEKKLIATQRVILKPGFHVPAGTPFKAKIGFTEEEAIEAAKPDFVQLVDYRYNIRGWLEKINDPAETTTEDHFSMNLRYDAPTANGGNAQFNGNISEAIWKTTGLNKQSYGYTYDPMNRLKEAEYFDAGNLANNNRFNETLGDNAARAGYDLNGNILNLFRNGKRDDGIYGQIDDLTYTITSGNKLTRVDDAQPDYVVDGFKEGTMTVANEYVYDAVGNMTKDQNKGLTGIEYNHLNLPIKVSRSTSEYIVYTYDATGRKLTQQVFGNTAKTTDYIGELIYEGSALQFVNHAEGRILPDGTNWEYQYHLKDHLGNVRLTFGTKEETTTDKATVEPGAEAQEEGKFLGFDYIKKINSKIYDRTNGTSPGTSIRLTGEQTMSSGNVIFNDQIGLSKSISVMPGDMLTADVYVKYLDPDTANYTSVFETLVAEIAAGSVGVVTTGEDFGDGFLDGDHYIPKDAPDGLPAGYLNWLIYDRDFNKLNSGFKRMDDSAREYGQDVTHQKLSSDPIVITEPGYVYIYFSNEPPTAAEKYEVYFDDFTVTHTKAPIVQMDDYYPFGLAFNSYSRENGTRNNYKYNGKEEQDELGINWFDFGARMYMPDIGRWGVIDPHADKYNMVSPFNYVFNSPINAIDPDGRDAIFTVTRNKKGKITGVTISATVYVTGEGASEERANELNENSSAVFNSKNIKGNVKVKLNIRYQYKEKIGTKDLKGGENILAFIDKKSTAEDRSKVQSHKIGETKFTGRVGLIHKDDWKDNNVIYHESLHFTGLPDMYQWDGTAMPGYEDDIMGNRKSSKIGYDHYNAYFNRASEVVNDPTNGKKYEKGFINRKSFKYKEPSEEQNKGL